ncbi:hypothetical protein BJF88_10740 [Cellulosimicrobium sp. CUA-896]|nr:hypothetical protein BJF88_10740 [Cellulosimicrobium sp. CUA-896]
MGFSIVTNVAANAGHRQLSLTHRAKDESAERLASGLRINEAADDTAGLTTAEGLRAQANGSAVAQRNAADAVAMLQTADGALGGIHDLLHRMRELALQAASDTNGPDARAALEAELGALALEIARAHNESSFNGDLLLHSEPTVTFQVGAEGNAASTIAVQLPRVTWAVTPVLVAGTGALGVSLTGAGDPAAAHDTSRAAVEAIDRAIARVSEERSRMGATINRIDHAARVASGTHENLRAAESAIRDADIAKEVRDDARLGLLAQAGTAMLAQANQAPSSVLQLLG